MNYLEYQFTKREFLENLAVFCLLDAGICYLFYDSFWAFALGLPFFKLFLKERKKTLCQRRQKQLTQQFLSAMQAVTASLTAGYSAETAVEDAYKEMLGFYREEEMIVKELRSMVSQLKMNRNLEELFLSLAVRSGIEDIRNFAEIFAVAKRSGGNLIAMIRNTVQTIGKKEETRGEIQASLSSKKLEQNIMSFIPCLILIYIQMVSPGFLDPMYHNPEGIVVMTISLGVYGTAVFWGRRIVAIEV